MDGVTKKNRKPLSLSCTVFAQLSFVCPFLGTFLCNKVSDGALTKNLKEKK